MISKLCIQGYVLVKEVFKELSYHKEAMKKTTHSKIYVENEIHDQTATELENAIELMKKKK